MIIKNADNKTKRLALLVDLKKSTLLDAYQRAWLEDELVRVRRGIEGERDAAHYIDSHLKDAKNTMVLHDLRLEVDGEVAQIDHLFFNRLFDFFLVETKCFNGSVQINEHGEFSVAYDSGKRFGIPSPIEQSKRHERILQKVLEKLEINGRMGVKPAFHHLVLMHPKSIIERPSKEACDTSMVMKADALPTWHKQWLEKDPGLVDAFSSLLTVRSADTIKEWGERLATEHKPANQLTLPDFMTPKAAVAPAMEAAPTWQSPDAQRPATPSPTSVSTPDESLKKRLICVTCGSKIPYNVGLFCWNNEKRFGGWQYCREHQRPDSA